MKILVVDDHALFREGLVYVLNGLENDLTILEASNYDEAIIYLNSHPDLDMVLLDLSMPDKDGFVLLSYCRKNFPLVSAVVLSASKQQSDLNRALDGGALGFIPKDTTSKVMLNALRLIISGEIYIPSSMTLRKNNNQNTQETLTPRQQEVVNMMMKGHSNKKIALEIGIAEATIKMHATSIFKRLGVSNRTEAALMIQKLELFK
ncbi:MULTISPECIES: response regulator transcription factor [unclassified Colwellia]|uniref:response regulator n=1 Tax=unclassified Colwellia TaxID=196834 RepID=UPI0015F65AAA|nr:MULTISPECIES: response regulator transcription factor [unclassified Colwellia]MBA6350087.1 response regulator transcription factor [Colwellia sp. BRX8-9]MBA6365633.1 response regulator transcription factor [Colwellia sp. BRX8-8]MBA6371406.1 response regulator transcription factor [Colwellia sp. BRX8-4]